MGITERTSPAETFRVAADLASLTPVDNQVFHITGLLTVGDGNGGTFYYDIDSAAVVDGVNVLLGPNGIGRYIRLGGAGGPGGTLEEIEVTVNNEAPTGNPITGNDIYIDNSTGTIYYVNESNMWESFGGDTDTHMANTNLTLNGDRTHQMIDGDDNHWLWSLAGAPHVVVTVDSEQTAPFFRVQTNSAAQSFLINSNGITIDSAVVCLDPSGAGGPTELRFQETTVNGDNYVGFKAATSLDGTQIWTLPTVDGSANWVLITDGIGNLSFVDVTTLASADDTHLFNTNSLALQGNYIHSLNSNTFQITQGTDTVFTLGTGTFSALTNNSAQGITVNSSGVTTTGAVVTLDAAASGSAPQLRFKEADVNGDNYVGFRAATTLAGDQIWVLPTADGSLNQALVTDGAGNLSWATVSGLVNDTNLFITDAQVLAGNYTHDLNGNAFEIEDANAQMHLANTAIWFYTGDGDAGGGQQLQLDTNGITLTGAAIILNPAVGGAAPDLRFKESQANGDNYVGFKAAASLAGDQIWTLPSADGTVGQALTTNGSGVLSWTTITSGDPDTNLFITDAQSLQGNFTHDLNSNTFQIEDGTGLVFTMVSGTFTVSTNSSAQVFSLSSTGALITATNLTLDPFTGGGAPELRFRESDAGGTNYVGFKAATTLAGNQIWTLPTADGTSGQQLTTNGSGVLSWADAGGGAGGGLFLERTFSSDGFDTDHGWGTASSGYYTITISQAILQAAGFTNVRGAQLYESDQVYPTTTANYDLILPDRLRISNRGVVGSGATVSIRVTESPDGRFEGAIIIYGD